MPMRPLAISLVAALAFGISAASAQEKTDSQAVQELKKENPVPPTTGPSLPEQNAKTEPSSKVPDTDPDPNVFVNGVLTVPGALTDVDTAPAKFSERTNAADQVPIAGYRLKHLTNEQRTEIVQGLGSQRHASSPAGTNGAYAVLGAEIPASVASTELAPIPEALSAKFPSLEGTAFMRTAGKVVVVDLDDSRVVGVL